MAAAAVPAYQTTYYNRAGASEFMDRLSRETLLVQGPMGTMLMSEPGAEEVPPVFWNLAEPQTVRRIHQLYGAAGAQVMLTNTFQASAPALERAGIAPAMEEVNRAAVDLARAAAGAYVMGSMGPCGIDWFRQDSPEFRAARTAYRDQAHALFAAGVDAVLLETFCSIRDVQPALAGALDVADGMPVLVSFSVDEAGSLLGDGLTIEGAVVYAEQHGASAVGVNCCSVHAACDAAPRMLASARIPVMVRPHAGMPIRGEDGLLSWDERPDELAAATARWREQGVRLVGSCCGATPRSTAAQSDALL